MVKKLFGVKIFALATIVVLLGSPVFFCAADASIIFSDNFESGTLNNWTSPIGVPTLSITTVHSGNYSACFPYTSAACYELKTITPTNTLNYTYYAYFGTLPANFLCVVLAEDIYGNEVYYRVQNINGVYYWQFDAGNAEVINSSEPVVSPGQWYKIQFLATTGSNSTFYFLVNDQLRATITNETLGPMSELHIGNDWIDFGNYAPIGETYVDDVVATNQITAFISAFAEQGGTITPSGAVDVPFDGDKTFYISANANFHISDVKVDGVSVGPVSQYTFHNVRTIHSIQAIFALNTYRIVASAGVNGVISPSGTITLEHGSSQSFTITANRGCHITDVTVNGSSVGAVNAYSFTNIQANYNIAATFAVDTSQTSNGDSTSTVSTTNPDDTPTPTPTPTPNATISPNEPTPTPEITQGENSNLDYLLVIVIVIIIVGAVTLVLVFRGKIFNRKNPNP